MFQKESYNRHSNWYNQQFPTKEIKVEYFRKSKSIDSNDLGTWLQNIFFACIDPLLKTTDQNWLTIGDPYGFDARYILKNKSRALATDLNTDMLNVAHQEGVVNEYRSENAENLSFSENSFDYVFCKESYHHFPRPYAAMYEMIRVAKKGVVIIEPQDPISKMPFLLFFVNIMAAIKDNLTTVFWKNRFSYEPVGNFVYKVSEREFEKFAAGLDLPLVAFKRINPNFYFKGAEDIEASSKSKKFRVIYFKKRMLDFLVKVKIIPSQVLSTIVFKKMPDEHTLKVLKDSQYHFVYIPKNPYLKERSIDS